VLQTESREKAEGGAAHTRPQNFAGRPQRELDESALAGTTRGCIVRLAIEEGAKMDNQFEDIHVTGISRERSFLTATRSLGDTAVICMQLSAALPPVWRMLFDQKRVDKYFGGHIKIGLTLEEKIIVLICPVDLGAVHDIASYAVSIDRYLMELGRGYRRYLIELPEKRSRFEAFMDGLEAAALDRLRPQYY
jgi:hypothetical protein